ncbi:Xenin [Drechslerella dactyloides]|uniref:Xenin n=1 Tax=Drechslerella dactyloides TaxID=74499 RepID=A0AAD6NJQ3_DREDA|nr:Xenin [Drechslerella dactyloides]
MQALAEYTRLAKFTSVHSRVFSNHESIATRPHYCARVLEVGDAGRQDRGETDTAVNGTRALVWSCGLQRAATTAEMASTGGAAGAASSAAGNAAPPTPSTSVPAPASSQNLNNIVIEYLSKKGYTKTEMMLRAEMAAIDSDGKTRSKDDKFAIYDKAYARLLSFVENSLDLYKPELRRVLFPVFVHIYLHLMATGHAAEAKKFFDANQQEFQTKHVQDLDVLSTINLPDQVEENKTSRKYLENKYHVTLTATSHNLLMAHLTEHEDPAGDPVITILNTRTVLYKVDRAPVFGFSGDDDMLGDNEGIPGNLNKDATPSKQLPAVKLGLLPMDKDLIADVEYELGLEDTKEKERNAELGTASGPTFLETFQRHIKREESEDTPMRDAIPLPPYRQIDIDMEIRNVKDYRNRYRLDNIAVQARNQPGLEGPAMTGPLPSVLTYTFHNTCDNMHRVAFNDDETRCATSHAESYVRLWSLNNEQLVSMNPSENENVSTTRRLVGHAGPVYGVSFSPDSMWLLSASMDKTVKLWNLKTYTALVSFKGHDNPVWDVRWAPFGHYFATASWDRTSRVWSAEHIAPVRIFAGHLESINRVAWHPNSAYVFTGSTDKTLRMWDMQQGTSVRLFNGHTAPVRCQEVSPNGKYLASGADDGTINIWDIGMGRRIKTMRGHARVPIWNLSWSVEGQVLVSGSADSSIRVWSVGEDKGNNAAGTGTVGAEMVINGIGGLPGDSTTKVELTAASGATALPGLGVKGRKDKKEVVATNDHLAVYYTKKTPVYTVKFTRKNLVLAAGAYLP